MLRVTFLAMALPVALSLAGPIYYGYTNGPYWRVLIWAGACTVGGSTFVHCGFQRRTIFIR
jgi:hypothetical protein